MPTREELLEQVALWQEARARERVAQATKDPADWARYHDAMARYKDYANRVAEPAPIEYEGGRQMHPPDIGDHDRMYAPTHFESEM